MPDEPSLRERKKQRTRQALIDGARHLFEEQGFEATTVAQIAAAAGVSTRTFFSYFSSKHDVLHDNMSARLDVGVQVIAAHAPTAPPGEVLVRAIDEMLADEWTMGLVAGLTGRDLPLPVSSPTTALLRSNTRLDRLAQALEDAYDGALDRVAAYALVGGAIGTVSAAVASSLAAGHTEQEALAAAGRACRNATAGFADLGLAGGGPAGGNRAADGDPTATDPDTAGAGHTGAGITGAAPAPPRAGTV